jgi:hypothetical protein
MQQRERTLVEEHDGGRAGEEADDEPAGKADASRMVIQGMSVHVRWTCTVAVQFITTA